ncbi:hypothetical protein ACFE04_030341 [Oxalis oulophora]
MNHHLQNQIWFTHMLLHHQEWILVAIALLQENAKNNFNDCPVAIHKDCLGGCEAKYDINGDFYRPYCWYKMLVSKTKELRCKAMLAKGGLSSFIDSKAGAGADGNGNGNGNADGDGDRGEEEENGKVSSVQGAEILVTLSGRMVDRNVCDSGNKSEGSKPVDRGQGERVDEEPIQEKSSAFCLAESEGKGESNLDKFGANGDEIVMEGLKEADSGEHERVDEDHHENKVLEKEEPVKAKPSVEVSNNVFLSVEDSGKTTSDERISNVPETTTLNKEDDIVPEKPTEDHVSYESSESYNVPRRRLVKKISKRKAENVQNVRKSPSQHKKCRIVNSPKRKSPRLNSPASGSTTNQSKNPITLRQPHQPTLKLSSLPGYKEIRKRIVWTPEEEEMLKEGVQHFAPSVNKNIPWRKILEYGRDVFDPTRNPNDLKDKWKLLLR